MPLTDCHGAATPTVSTAARIVRILESFGHRHRWGVRELAAHLGLSSSSVHRGLQELEGEGVLRAEPDGTYTATGGLLRLGVLLSGASDLPGAALLHLNAARDCCQETVILLAYDASRRRCTAVAAAESPRPVRYIWESLRGWNDLHLGATGKGILAFLNESDRDAVLDALPDPIPGPLRRSKQELRNDLEVTRERGWAVSVGERYAGARGVCAPVRDASHRVVGAVAIGWPDHPHAEERVNELGALCRDTADAVTAELRGDSS
jgi:DNA-binding IclR family transcriptional regulator